MKRVSQEPVGFCGEGGYVPAAPKYELGKFSGTGWDQFVSVALNNEEVYMGQASLALCPGRELMAGHCIPRIWESVAE